MGRQTVILLPKVKKILSELGENIRFARLRRRLSAALVAERAGISRNTLRSIERGDPKVTFGAYVNVLFSLGLEKDLKLIAQQDELGRRLQDASLSFGKRAPKKTSSIKKVKSEEENSNE